MSLIRSTFKTRFLLAKLCRKVPPLTFIVDKMFFEGNDILLLPRDNAVSSNKDEVIQINSSIKNENTILPSQVLKEMILKSKYTS